MEGEGPKRLEISVTGPADVTAGDIAVTGDIEAKGAVTGYTRSKRD